jgi:outer membrane protein assembly factor BamB
MKIRLTSRTFTDFGVLPAEIPQVNYVRSLAGKVNIEEQPATATHNCLLSFANKLNVTDLYTLTLTTNVKRGLISKIDSSSLDVPSIAALRRRNLPLPPSGVLTVLRSLYGWSGSPSQTEEKLSGNTLAAGDTHIIVLTALGDFPATPEVVFALYDTSGELIVKSNLSTQGDINIDNIASTSVGSVQKLTAQIVLYPADTKNISVQKVLLYKVEIVDVLADEVYTIESGKVTLKPDILDYFAVR